MIVEFIDSAGNVEVGTILSFMDTSVTQNEVMQNKMQFKVILPCGFQANKVVLPDGTSYVVKPISVSMDGTVCIYTFVGEPEEADVLW